MNKNSKIYVAGHRGLVGSAIVCALQRGGFNNLVLRTRQELDLTDQHAVAKFFEQERPEYVFLAAAKVGGIMANKTFPAEFIYENLAIQTNIIHNAYMHKTKKLLFLGSSCIYPRLALQPIKEEYLMDGKLEPTNEAYAVAKIAGITMCQSYNKQYGTNFISVMPTNLYGPNDNFDTEKAHVLPALMRRFHEAKNERREEVVVFGTGKAKREFLHTDDIADACVFLMNTYSKSDIVNIGTGKDVSIKALALMIKKVVGFKGKIAWDATKPDGTPRKLLNVSKLHTLGWKHSTPLDDGIASTYKWFKENYK
ncbi:MAG: NAD-dependent epimerase/dehydratase [Parcubacteria group bacterium GW2011_GWA1_47_8]|nr:MAG: NAD-dependent epimerase/dehydratase [Parcubacteria group bacterium GW2011_GWA1_47_8]